MILSIPTNILRNFKEFSAIDSDTWESRNPDHRWYSTTVRQY